MDIVEILGSWIRNRYSIYKRDWILTSQFDWKASLVCVIGSILLWPLVNTLPVLGWDWYIYFTPRVFEGVYPPWTAQVLAPFLALPWRQGFGLVASFTLVTLAVAAAREARGNTLFSRLQASFFALFNPIVFMILWEGNIDGIGLFGLITLPAGVVFLLLKPTIAGWGVLARKQWTIWAIGLVLLSFLVWGIWPISRIGAFDNPYKHPMAMGWYNLGWPIALIGIGLLINTNADPFRLMAAGSLVVSYTMPYHYTADVN